jgi:hypothetical protein
MIAMSALQDVEQMIKELAASLILDWSVSPDADPIIAWQFAWDGAAK